MHAAWARAGAPQQYDPRAYVGAGAPAIRHKMKIVVIGPMAVGKTSLVSRLFTDTFDSRCAPTIGIDFTSKAIDFVEPRGVASRISLQIWDTAGQERFRSLVPSYLRGADVVIVAYDAAGTRDTAAIRAAVMGWVEDAVRNRAADPDARRGARAGGERAPEHVLERPALLFVGNKIDLVAPDERDSVERQRAFFVEMLGATAAHFSSIDCMQLSAKAGGVGVRRLFDLLCAIARAAFTEALAGVAEPPGVNVELRERTTVDFDAAPPASRSDCAC